MTQPLLVTGAHRSGTSFVGKELRKSGGFDCFHEPFNLTCGLQGIKEWFPHVPSSRQSPEALIVDFFMCMDAWLKHPRHAGGGSLARGARDLFGSRNNLRGIMRKYVRASRSVLLMATS